MATPPTGSPCSTYSMMGPPFGPPLVVSREVLVSVSLVTAMAEPSWLWAMPNGSPGIVKLRVLPGWLGSLPLA